MTYRDSATQGRKPPRGGGKNADPAEPTARALRFAARSVLWDLSKIKRIRACGNLPVANAGQSATCVAVRHRDGGAGFAGLETCGSVWACPVCSAKVRSQRAAELERALAAHLATGGSAYFLTLTMRHKKADALADLWGHLAAAWNSAKSGRTYREGKDLTNLNPRHAERFQWLRSQGVSRLPGADALGVLGIARFVEATHGAHGWHLHAHAVVFVAGKPDEGEVREWSLGVFDRWRHTLAKRGLRAPIASRGGLDIRPVYGPEGLGIYAAKAGADADAIAAIASRASREATRADVKKGRKANRTPWQVLADFATYGDAVDIAIWHEWEKASRGKRFAVWSRNADERWQALLAARGEVKTDEEVAAEDQGGETLGYIARRDWLGIHRNGALLDRVLTAAATGSAAAVAAVLEPHGVALLDEPPQSRPPDD